MNMHPPVVGTQVHHSQYLDRMCNANTSYMQYLASVESLLGAEPDEKDVEFFMDGLDDLFCEATSEDVRTAVLRAVVKWLQKQTSDWRNQEQAKMRQIHKEAPELFKAYVDGRKPWPGWDPLRWQGRCNCHDLCFHRFDDPHELINSPWFECKCDGVRPPCPVPGHPT